MRNLLLDVVFFPDGDYGIKLSDEENDQFMSLRGPNPHNNGIGPVQCHSELLDGSVFDAEVPTWDIAWKELAINLGILI